MVGYACAYHNVEYAGIAAGSSGYAGVDDQFRLEKVDKRHGSHCGIDFADAAFHGHDLGLADCAGVEREAVDFCFCGIFQEMEQQGKLFVHCYDYAYFHCRSFWSWIANLRILVVIHMLFAIFVA